jgi:hypothetical protein
MWDIQHFWLGDWERPCPDLIPTDEKVFYEYHMVRNTRRSDRLPVSRLEIGVLRTMLLSIVRYTSNKAEQRRSEKNEQERPHSANNAFHEFDFAATSET